MADNMSDELREVSATTVQCFSIAINENTDVQDVAQVAMYKEGNPL